MYLHKYVECFQYNLPLLSYCSVALKVLERGNPTHGNRSNIIEAQHVFLFHAAKTLCGSSSWMLNHNDMRPSYRDHPSLLSEVSGCFLDF